MLMVFPRSLIWSVYLKAAYLACADSFNIALIDGSTKVILILTTFLYSMLFQISNKIPNCINQDRYSFSYKCGTSCYANSRGEYCANWLFLSLGFGFVLFPILFKSSILEFFHSFHRASRQISRWLIPWYVYLFVSNFIYPCVVLLVVGPDWLAHSPIMCSTADTI